MLFTNPADLKLADFWRFTPEKKHFPDQRSAVQKRGFFSPAGNSMSAHTPTAQDTHWFRFMLELVTDSVGQMEQLRSPYRKIQLHFYRNLLFCFLQPLIHSTAPQLSAASCSDPWFRSTQGRDHMWLKASDCRLCHANIQYFLTQYIHCMLIQQNYIHLKYFCPQVGYIPCPTYIHPK